VARIFFIVDRVHINIPKCLFAQYGFIGDH